MGPSDEAAEPFAPGARIGHFVIVETLGAGAMGVVLAARDPDLDRKVAVKVVRPLSLGIEGTSEARARLLREARAWPSSSTRTS